MDVFVTVNIRAYTTDREYSTYIIEMPCFNHKSRAYMEIWTATCEFAYIHAQAWQVHPIHQRNAHTHIHIHVHAYTYVCIHTHAHTHAHNDIRANVHWQCLHCFHMLISWSIFVRFDRDCRDICYLTSIKENAFGVIDFKFDLSMMFFMHPRFFLYHACIFNCSG